MSNLLVDWVRLIWAPENLAEAAGKSGKTVEHPNLSQPNPGRRADGTPCISFKMFIDKMKRDNQIRYIFFSLDSRKKGKPNLTQANAQGHRKASPTSLSLAMSYELHLRNTQRGTVQATRSDYPAPGRH